jgi:hypothetical protein
MQIRDVISDLARVKTPGSPDTVVPVEKQAGWRIWLLPHPWHCDGARAAETSLRVEEIMDRARTSLGNSTTAHQLVELGLVGGYSLYERRRLWIDGPRCPHENARCVRRLARLRALVARIDERAVKHVAQLLTSNNVRNLEKGIKLISRNKTLFKGTQNSDAAAGAVGTRGAESTVRGDLGVVSGVPA